MTSKKQLPFDGYVRVSRVSGRSGDSYRSPGDQRAVIDRLVAAHGLALGEVVTEEDVSGGKKSADRELDRLVQKITGTKDEEGEWIEKPTSSGLLVWKVSRFSRNLADGVLTAKAIADAGGRIIGEDLDTAAPMGKALLGFLLGYAEEELDARRESWQRASEGAIERGVYVGSTPVGYDRVDGGLLPEGGTVSGGKKDGRLLKNKHAPAIERAFRIRATGGSWTEVARSLSEAGVPTATGQTEWGISSVGSMMRNPIYKGELRNGHVHQFPEYGIIEPSVWEKANRRAKSPGRKDGGSWAVLGGMLFCGGCEHRLTPHHTVRTRRGNVEHYRYYTCNNTKCRSRARIRPDEIEPLVAEAAYDYFSEFISQAGIGRDADTERIVALEIERDEAERRFAAWERTSDPLDPGYEETKLRYREAIQAAARAIQDELTATRRYPSAEEVRSTIDTGTAAEKRQVIRQVVSGATVWKKGTEPKDASGDGSSTSRISDRVEVAWKTLVI